MRQLFKNLFIPVLVLLTTVPCAFSAIKGGIEYQIPIDYRNLNKAELEEKANFYYDIAIKNKRGNIDENMTDALNLYTILSNQNPGETKYFIKLGYLYDIAGKDRYSKGNFYRAISVNNHIPEPYFGLGEYFYTHNQIRKALKMYLEAYKKGYSNHYQTLYKLGCIYEKLGDTRVALEYYRTASRIEPSDELDAKITQLQNNDSSNKNYYSQ